MIERQELTTELASHRWQELLALLYAARCLRPACVLAGACIAALRRALCADNPNANPNPNPTLTLTPNPTLTLTLNPNPYPKPFS